MKTPTTIEEWQNVVNLADMLLGLDSARQYGLIQGGSSVNVIRCQKLIKDGAEQDVKPNWTNDHLAAFIGEMYSKETGSHVPRTAREIMVFVSSEAFARRRAGEDGAPEDPADDADTPPEGSPTPEGSQDAG